MNLMILVCLAVVAAIVVVATLFIRRRGADR